MRVAIIEPLGVEENFLIETAKGKLGASAEIEYFGERTSDTKELIKRGKAADVIVVSNLPLKKEVIEGCKNLKMISVAFAGVDHIDMDFCRQKGITVCNCAGYSNRAVSELVFGGVISLMRNIIKCDERTRNGLTKDGLTGSEIFGKKFGIIGCGQIGKRVATIAEAFGCEVFVTEHSQKVNLPFAKIKTKDEIMAECDIISLHVPLNNDTRLLIGKKEISLMKKNAILVNTARGGVVDSCALAEALNEGKIGGAVVDVFENEPPIDKNHPLLSAKNTVLTPHVAFATNEALELRCETVFENVRSFIEGNPINICR